MTSLNIQNIHSFLNTTNDDLKHILWQKLRFRDKNYFHSSAYKRRIWDGYTEFFKKDSGKFLTGLLPEIVTALSILKEPFTASDTRNKIQFIHQEIDKNFLPGIEMYDYQVDFINQAIKYQRGIIKSPTGSGKTFILLGALKCLPEGVPTLILANKKSLVEQNYSELKNIGFNDVGRLYDKYNEIGNITCATVQSLHKMQSYLPKIQALFVDEIHELMSKEPKKYYNKLANACVRVGISATPFKFGGSDKTQKYEVKGYFGPIFKTKSPDGVLTTKELQERKILSDSKCIFYPIDEPQIPYDVYQDAVTHGIAESYHFHETVKNLVKTLKGRTLILVERIAHGDSLNHLIPEAIWIRGKDNLETRKEVIKKLQSGKGNVVAIATHGIFNTGINVKVTNLVNAAGGTAEHQIIQRMGRGLRTADDKDILNYYDFIFRINEYLHDHSKNRIKVLEKEGHEVIIKDTLEF